MSGSRPGPDPGSNGARRIGDAHRGHHDHDSAGGFANNPELASKAGTKGGNALLKKYGRSHLQEIGTKGGEAVLKARGREFFIEIGRKGAETRKKNRELMGEY